MKRRTVMHGNHIIRVYREINSKSGQIDIENFRTKTKIIIDIDNKGVFKQKDNNNFGKKVIEKAITVYRGLV